MVKQWLTFQINLLSMLLSPLKIVSENEQGILQSQTADKPMAQQERATQQSPDTRKTY